MNLIGSFTIATVYRRCVCATYFVCNTPAESMLHVSDAFSSLGLPCSREHCSLLLHTRSSDASHAQHGRSTVAIVNEPLRKEMLFKRGRSISVASVPIQDTDRNIKKTQANGIFLSARTWANPRFKISGQSFRVIAVRTPKTSLNRKCLTSLQRINQLANVCDSALNTDPFSTHALAMTDYIIKPA